MIVPLGRGRWFLIHAFLARSWSWKVRLFRMTDTAIVFLGRLQVEMAYFHRDDCGCDTCRFRHGLAVAIWDARGDEFDLSPSESPPMSTADDPQPTGPNPGTHAPASDPNAAPVPHPEDPQAQPATATPSDAGTVSDPDAGAAVERFPDDDDDFDDDLDDEADDDESDEESAGSARAPGE